MNAEMFAQWTLGRASLLRPALTVALALGAQSLPAQSVDESTMEPIIVLEPVIVTAQMREQAAIEVPISMTVLSGTFMNQLKIQDMADLSAYVPGFEAQLQSPNNPGFAIRGITTDSGDAYSEPRVSIYLDGVSISKSRGSAVELFDMERIEVLKGPQSTLFGRGASSGAFSLITNKPRNETSAELTVGGGNLGQYRAEGYFNTPIADDALLLRVATTYRHRDGYIENLADGADDDLNGVETFAVRPSVRYLFGNGGTADLIATFQKDNYTATSFLQRYYPPVGQSATDIHEYGALNRGDVLGIDRTIWGVTGIITLPLTDSMTLTSTSAYRTFDAYEEFDADGTHAYILEAAEDAESEQWSQELRVNWTAGDSLEGFFGANYFYSDSETRVPIRTDERLLYAHLSPQVAASLNPGIQQINAMLGPLGISLPLVAAEPAIWPNGTPNTSNATLPYGAYAAMAIQQQLAMGVPPTSLQLPPPSTTPAFNPLHEEGYTNYGTQQAWELFGDATWKLSDVFALTGGVRFTQEDIESGYRADLATPSFLAVLMRGASTAGNILYVPTDGKITASDTYTSVVGRIVANYTPTDDLNLYTSYSRGRRPPVISVSDSGSNPNLIKLEPETLDSYEVGFKSFLANRRIQLDAAAYYYTYKDFATSVYRNNQLVSESIGDAEALGAEVSLDALVQPGLNVFATYGWIDGSFGGEETSPYYNQTFRLTPRNSYAVGLNYTINTGAGKLFFTPSYTWKSRVYYTEDPNDTLRSQPAYGLLNVRCGIQREGWQLTLFVKNLLDEDYIIDAGNSGDNIGLPTFISGAPRLWGVELTVRM